MNIKTILYTGTGYRPAQNRYINLLVQLSLLVWMVLLFTNCKNDPSTSEQPEPQEPTLHLTKIRSEDKSYQSFAYNLDGSLASSEISWFYPDSTSTYSQLNAEYNSQKKISKIVINARLAVAFFYQGTTLERTEEYDHRNRLAVTHFYTFDQQGMLTTLLDQVHSDEDSSSDYYTKFIYTYDEKGNVKEVNSFRKVDTNAPFTPLEQIIFQDYDDQKNPMQPQLSYPFLPAKCTQRNNPGKITIKLSKNQSVISEQVNIYQYNDYGYPISVVRQLTTMKPLPPTKLLFSYE
jgi:hypothetical protein